MTVSIQPGLTKEHRLSSRSLPPWKDLSLLIANSLYWAETLFFSPVLESREHQFSEVSSLLSSLPPGSFSTAIILCRNGKTSCSDPWPRASEHCSSHDKPRVAVGISAENKRSPLLSTTLLELRPAPNLLEVRLWQLKSDRSVGRNQLVYTMFE